jgi:hypothetical protein
MVTPITNTPILWINAYLQDSLKELGFETVPFFPATPSTVNDLTEFFPPGGVMCTYDKMIRLRKSPFPHIKTQQVIYYFYATAENSTMNMIKIVEKALRLMDREDETAQELNLWAANKGSIIVDGQELTPDFFFHRFRLFQLQETKDIIQFATARTYGGNKLIIEFDYHMSTEQ